MKVLITGADGFIGKNLRLYLVERKDIDVICFTRDNDESLLPEMLNSIDLVFHLAGINRPGDYQEFYSGNQGLTSRLCEEIVKSGRKIPVLYTSSIQAKGDNHYGLSKRAAEEVLFGLQRNHSIPIYVFRLPNVFGKWCKPNYNSVVATFCYNIAREFPIQVDDPSASLSLVYIDDLIERFVQLMDGADSCIDADGFEVVTPLYSTTVGKLAKDIYTLKESRSNLFTERVGVGFMRALYSTYVSYLPTDKFAYQVQQHRDTRGSFVEMLKTPDCGQFSYFTAYPGVTRGGHYHNTKTEKFLVIKGQARFRFRHMHTDETYELITNGDSAEVVETVPGWTHDITNIGNDEMVVMLWANEVFDRKRPDTFACLL